MEKKDILRAVVAIVLSLAVWVGWMYFFKDHMPQEQKPQQPAATDAAHKAPGDASRQAAPHATGPATPAARPHAVLAAAPAGVEAKDIELKTGVYSVVFTTRGAAIKSFTYAAKKVELVVPKSKYNATGLFDFALHISEDEFLNGSALDSMIWSHAVKENTVVFSATATMQGLPVRIEKVYTLIPGKHHFTVETRIANLGRTPLPLPNKYLIMSPSDFMGPALDFENTYNQVNSMFQINGGFEKPNKGGGFFSKNEGPTAVQKGAVTWVGVSSRYFLIVMLANGFSGTGAIYDNRADRGFRAGMYVPVDSIQPGTTLARSFKVYVGEKNKDLLAEVDKSMVDATDISRWIEPIRDFLLWCLMKINILFGNFGWSLVVFSIVTKLIFLPLTMKSTESMKKMQDLNPKIQEIREKFKDKPDVVNKKIMEMYKKEKVNPLSGCLPLLLQMPFFFALYSALINSVDLWQAPFVLWITDLSLPDTVYAISGFNINILPIFMTATTYLQQRMTTTEGTSQQQKMMMFMPLIFIVIFWNMPSGLVLYWTMQNVLQIGHQLYINKRGDKKKESPSA
ncbi:MAG TPA: membrane protein insertase YidC [Spirochaetota bacterium]|nr:membrane protein insertase YidC [Spirochaetota bacterium]HNT09960.1 membrane protein insertase YidC [Spirochaetota bacterium]HNV45708.1 membrane protein insertase YidC [Spirochaetota bacterium]HOS38391.1 membrane protein insertase YidC [Spirochaetota bacterium]HPI21607.1 membrane protein insertase YidC [Spirochaetota bacterium]